MMKKKSVLPKRFSVAKILAARPTCAPSGPLKAQSTPTTFQNLKRFGA
jgi:hypothetical protein